MENHYKHFFLSGKVSSEKYKTTSGGGGEANIPARNRVSHSARLLKEFDAIWEENRTLNQQREAVNIPTREGTYLSFKSQLNHDLITKSLENIGSGIRILNIRETTLNDDSIQVRATVYVPKGKETYFINKIKKYQSEDTKSGKPQNAPLINSIEDVSLTLLESFWIDDKELMPEDDAKWCEVWLNINTRDDLISEEILVFKETLKGIGIEYKENSIVFPERAVLLIRANRKQLIELMMRSDFLAEFRIGQEPAGFWMNETSTEQQDWVEDLLERLEVIDSNVKVCILDTGVNNAHQLLQPILDNDNVMTANPEWGTYDHFKSKGGHGTLMAGLSGYGKLEEALLSTHSVTLTHKLCSIKILPSPNREKTPKELWGDITAQGISRAEIQNPEIVFIYCMAVTSKEDVNKGRPSSWSGEIDNLTFGDGENQRLIIISAGNIENEENWLNYPSYNFLTSIQNPAQAWNALTVGAFTEKIQVKDPDYDNYETIAKVGELSPYSTTSLVWEKKWPIKPDIVFEGGNLLKSPDNHILSHQNLELLSTSKSIQIKPFETISATSAATAQASWFAAKIAYEYPEAWPESIRGLMVHSASWNDAMLRQLDVEKGKRADYKELLKVFGYGSPNLERALYSRESALTFVSQEVIQPYGFNEKKQPETNEIHLFDFPWPEEDLLQLGEVPVTLKITLSYFIQPGAGEIGWKDKYRYQSHGLRFDINNVGENKDDFRKRINAAAREKGEKTKENTASNRWEIGINNRNNGSIHSDYWKGTAADLATCNFIAVYPVIGWWRERKHLGFVENKTRYSLIISLETPSEDVELYTTIKSMIEVPIRIQV